MLSDIKELEKITDILNSEGTILGLYNLDKKLYLSSFLTDHTGEIYYSTTKEKLLQYLRSKIMLQELYLESDDIFVSRQLRNYTGLHLKQDFANVIKCSGEYYEELSEALKNPEIERIIKRWL